MSEAQLTSLPALLSPAKPEADTGPAAAPQFRRAPDPAPAQAPSPAPTPSGMRDPRQMIRRMNVLGLTLVLAFVGGIGGWAATSELAGAVIGNGTITVDGNVKKVQHPSGGVVKEILVKEGAEVEEGQILVRLD